MEKEQHKQANGASAGFSFGGWKGQRLATPAAPFAHSASQLAHRKQVILLPANPPLEQEGVEDRAPEEASGAQLRSEGSELAEAGRYREALAKWEHALLLTPDDPLLFELKAQVLMEEERWWAAVLAATRATELDPRWADGFVTRGRAELNYGEVALAIASFERALGLLPPDHDSASPVRDELAQARALHSQLVERERAAPPIDYDALKYRKRRAIIGEQNQREQPPGGEQPTTTTTSENERGADDDGGQDPRTLWETMRQVGQASLRERRGRTDQQDGTTNDFIEEFDEAEGGEEEEQMDIEVEKKGSNQ